MEDSCSAAFLATSLESFSGPSKPARYDVQRARDGRGVRDPIKRDSNGVQGLKRVSSHFGGTSRRPRADFSAEAI